MALWAKEKSEEHSFSGGQKAHVERKKEDTRSAVGKKARTTSRGEKKNRRHLEERNWPLLLTGRDPAWHTRTGQTGQERKVISRK